MFAYSELSPPIILVASAIFSIVLVMGIYRTVSPLMSPTHYTIIIIIIKVDVWYYESLKLHHQFLWRELFEESEIPATTQLRYGNSENQVVFQNFCIYVP